MFLIPVNCTVYCVTPIIAHHSSITTILLTGWQLVSDWSQQNLKIDSNAKRSIISYIPTLWDFVHVLATFDISFKYVPPQWIHFPLEQDRNCLIKFWKNEVQWIVYCFDWSSVYNMIIVMWCQFSHIPSMTAPYSLHIDLKLIWTMKSMGRYKCQRPVSTFSAVILVLCLVITSYQVSYFINIFLWNHWKMYVIYFI